MTINSNQFNVTAVKGLVDASTPNRLIPAKIDDDEATTLVAGQLVKIANKKSRMLPLTASTAETDAHAGVLVFSTHRDKYVAGNIVEFAPLHSGAIVLLEAGGAISNGAKVYYGASQKVASSGTIVIGHAYDKATANGDLIRVILD